MAARTDAAPPALVHYSLRRETVDTFIGTGSFATVFAVASPVGFRHDTMRRTFSTSHPQTPTLRGATICLLVSITGCQSDDALWQQGLADMDRKIEAEIARGPSAESPRRPAADPNSQVAQLGALGRASDVEQAAFMERGIRSAVALQAANSAEGSAVPTDGAGPGIERVWGLAELAAAALEANPATRESWYRARAAAAREQNALAAYAPRVGVEASMSYFDRPGESFSPQAEADREARFSPQMYASWLLLDFGRRDADTDRARAEVAATNLSHDRTLQRTVYEVQDAYFELESTLGLRAAAEQDVIAAASVLKSTERRLSLGLATKPDLLISRQSMAEAISRLEKRRADVFVAEGDLRSVAGFPVSTALPIDPTPESELPEILTNGIDGIIDQALAQRPDLAAVVMELRAREADVRKAQANYLPEVAISGTLGGSWYYFDQPGFNILGQGWGFAGSAIVGGRWLLYDDGARDATLAEVNAQRAVAAARLARARLDAAEEVWRAYYSLQSSRAQYDAAKARLSAAAEAFAAVKRAYELGLATLPDLLEIEQSLSEARAERIEARSGVLCASAQLIFAAGSGFGEVR